jgi:hypothetical protein
MRGSKVVPGLIGLVMLFTVGCSPLHTEIDLGYHWTTGSSVILEAPAQDLWGLTPVVRQELQELGYALLLPEAGNPDLVVRFTTLDGPDFTPEGLSVTRPKSLHVQFVDPDSEALLAVADYFLLSSEDPAAGMRTALIDLHQRIRNAGSSAPSVNRSQIQAAVPAAEKSAASVPQADNPPITLPSTSSGDGSQATFPEATTESPPSPANTIADSEPMVRPLKQSSWAPRFQSWGFADWGKADDAER